MLRRARLKSYSGRTSAAVRRRATAVLAFALCIVFALTACHLPRADQPNGISPLREHYHEQTTPNGVPEQHEALLALGMARVLDDSAEWISEDGDLRRKATRCLKRRSPLGEQRPGRCLEHGGAPQLLVEEGDDRAHPVVEPRSDRFNVLVLHLHPVQDEFGDVGA